MNTLKRYKYPVLFITLVAMIAGSFLLGSRYALNHLVLRQITPTEAANAMKDDHLWSSYREDTLLMTGYVTSVSQNESSTLVTFKTDSSFGAECSFMNLHGSIAKGRTIKVITIANAAEREASGVKLNNCLMQ